MSETLAQKRERILRGERTHDEPRLFTPATFAETQLVQAATPLDKLTTLLACPSDWIAGRGGPITSFVVHCTASTNPAASTANFFHSCASDHGSTQYAFDDVSGFLCVPLNAICAGAPPLNQEGVHAEQTGLVEWSRATWLSHMDQMRRMALFAAKTCKDNGLPVRLLHADDLRREGEKAKGITYHAAITEAFHQSTHTDPGPNYPWDVFMPLVQGFFDGTAGGIELALTEQQQDFTVGMILAVKGQTPAADASDAVKNGFRLTKEKLAAGGAGVSQAKLDAAIGGHGHEAGVKTGPGKPLS